MAPSRGAPTRGSVFCSTFPVATHSILPLARSSSCSSTTLSASPQCCANRHTLLTEISICASSTSASAASPYDSFPLYFTACLSTPSLQCLSYKRNCLSRGKKALLALWTVVV